MLTYREYQLLIVASLRDLTSEEWTDFSDTLMPLAVETIDMSNGGIVHVVLGPGHILPTEYLHSPRVLGISERELKGLTQTEKSYKISGNCKICLFTDEVPAHIYHALTKVLDSKRIPYMTRRAPESVRQSLDELFPKPKTLAPKPRAEVGSTTELVKEADLTKTAADEARRLLKLAGERGINTTFGALQQAIGSRKRKEGVSGERPRSAMSGQQIALKILDEAIDGLKTIRDFVSNNEAENMELRSQLAKIKQTLGVK